MTLSTSLPAYMFAFCRIVIGLVFLFSSAGKILQMRALVQTIQRFHLLPTRLSTPAAACFLCGECAVVVFLCIGGPLLWPGFALALFLLLLFCAAMVSVIARGIHTSCNCFGTSEKEVTRTDIWRNVGFILCTLGGCSALRLGVQEYLNLAEWIVIGLCALVFVVIWLQLHEIVSLFRQG